MGMRSAILIFISILLIGGGIFSRSRYSSRFQAHLLQTIHDNLEDEFIRMEEEAKKLLAEHLAPTSDTWDKVNHFFIHADSSRIITWNRSYFQPGIAALQSLPAGKKTLMQTPRGDFLILKWNAENSTYLYGIITLADRYPIVNNFLSAQANPLIFPMTNVFIADPLSKGGLSLTIGNETICNILSENPRTHESLLSFLLLGAGFALFLYGLWSIIQWIQQRLNYDIAFLTFLSSFVVVRLEMIFFGLSVLFF